MNTKTRTASPRDITDSKKRYSFVKVIGCQSAAGLMFSLDEGTGLRAIELVSSELQFFERDMFIVTKRHTYQWL